MTVGDDDLSSRATTTMTLGLVRAAQGRDDDAEALLLEALALVEHTGFRGLEAWVTTRLEEFLRERGRDKDAGATASVSSSSRRPPASSHGLRQQDRANQLRRRLVRRLRDHRRRPLDRPRAPPPEV